MWVITGRFVVLRVWCCRDVYFRYTDVKSMSQAGDEIFSCVLVRVIAQAM